MSNRCSLPTISLLSEISAAAPVEIRRRPGQTPVRTAQLREADFVDAHPEQEEHLLQLEDASAELLDPPPEVKETRPVYMSTAC